jgi:hypothetical protein
MQDSMRCIMALMSFKEEVEIQQRYIGLISSLFVCAGLHTMLRITA